MKIFFIPFPILLEGDDDLVDISTYYRAFRLSVNGFTCWMLFMAGITALPISPVLGVGLLISGIDAFFDVLMALGLKLKESEYVILRYINYLTEGVAVVVGSFLACYGILYYNYFESWFFRSLTIVGLVTVLCAMSDLLLQFAPKIELPKALLGVSGKYVRVKKADKD